MRRDAIDHNRPGRDTNDGIIKVEQKSLDVTRKHPWLTTSCFDASTPNLARNKQLS